MAQESNLDGLDYGILWLVLIPYYKLACTMSVEKLFQSSEPAEFPTLD